MSIEYGDILRRSTQDREFSGNPEGELAQLTEHLRNNIVTKIGMLEAEGKNIDILSPEWCRVNPVEAGSMHADVIVNTYGSTYALPNKDPIANKTAIESGDLDLYLMLVNGELTGTTCLVDTHDGRAELGRSASSGRSGNTIIQDLRILEWLEQSDSRFHTLFTTLRNAPDRIIDDADGEFVMRGGQAVTEHWKKFPALRINGVAPLYLKHGKLEQFTCASLTKGQPTHAPLFLIEEGDARAFVHAWHKEYDEIIPPINIGESNDVLRFKAHYPPHASGLTSLVHADIVPSDTDITDQGQSINESIEEAENAGSPFVQFVLPIDVDTRDHQLQLLNTGFQIFGYQQGTTHSRPSLLFGRVRRGIEVVSTHWDMSNSENPFWHSEELQVYSRGVAGKW